MKVINSKLHGILDYLVGAVLIICPWLFGFANSKAQTIVLVVAGSGAIAYSIFTKYELGVFKMIPFKYHLIIDTIAGILLACSPWLFGFAEDIHIPHLIFGLLELAVVLLTQPSVTGNYTKSRINSL